MEGDPAAEIHLVAFKPHSGMLSSGTPFGCKVEVLLRLAGLPYLAHEGNVADRKTCPKSKVCFQQASPVSAVMHVHVDACMSMPDVLHPCS